MFTTARAKRLGRKPGRKMTARCKILLYFACDARSHHTCLAPIPCSPPSTPVQIASCFEKSSLKHTRQRHKLHKRLGADALGLTLLPSGPDLPSQALRYSHRRRFEHQTPQRSAPHAYAAVSSAVKRTAPPCLATGKALWQAGGPRQTRCSTDAVRGSTGKL